MAKLQWMIAMNKFLLMYIPFHKIYRNVHIKRGAHNYVIASSISMAKESPWAYKGHKG